MHEQTLIEPLPSSTPSPIRINEDCMLYSTEGTESVSVRGIPVLSGQVGDVAFRRLVMVQLVDSGAATRQEVARSFDVKQVTLYRHREAFEKYGTAGLVPRKRGPKGPSKLKPRKLALIRKLRTEGATYRQIGQRLGVAESSVRAALRRESDHPRSRQDKLPIFAEAAAPSEAMTEEVELSPADKPSAISASEPESVERAPVPASDAHPAMPDPPAGEPSVRSAPDPGSVEPAAAVDVEPVKQGVPASEASATSTSGAESVEPAAGSVSDVEPAKPDVTAGSEPSATSTAEAESLEIPQVPVLDVDPANRAVDRMLARQGMLQDAGPLFGTARRVPGLGVLLAIPILVLHGVFADATRTFQGLGAAFYGLRTTVLTLLVCFLRGINRPENLKEYSPAALGQVLGLDRAPEMKTLRRKIRALAAQGQSLEFIRRQAQRALKRLSAQLLWLYVDGHVAVYSGKHKLAKHHVTQMRIALPSVLDYWVNDETGDPVLVWSGSRAKDGLGPVLEDVIKELRGLGEQRDITLVFDRGGWSPALFARLLAMPGVHIVTYRKAPARKKLPRLPKKSFKTYEKQVGGEKVTYDLADTTVRLTYGRGKKKSRLELRQVTRRTDDGHQTHVLTDLRDCPALEIAHRMFGRWSQENFLKYMGEYHDFDGLLSYLMEEDPEPRTVANPKRASLKERIAKLQGELEALRAEYGERARLNSEPARPTMRGFKIANGKLGQEIERRRHVLSDLQLKLRSMPPRIPAEAQEESERPMRVNTEVRQIIHGLHMAARRTESALRELLRSGYRRWREDSRTLVRSFLRTTGDLEVRGDQLRVTLDAQSAPHRTRALAQICAHLTSMRVRFPGSALTLFFEVRGAENGSASR